MNNQVQYVMLKKMVYTLSKFNHPIFIFWLIKRENAKGIRVLEMGE